MKAVFTLVLLLLVSSAIAIRLTNDPAPSDTAAPKAAGNQGAPATKEGEKKEGGAKKEKEHKKEKHHVSFSYDCKNPSDPSCPKNWGSLKMKDNQCGSKKRQSPINLPYHELVSNFSSWKITADYENIAAGATLLNNGHTVQIDFPDEKKGQLTVNYGKGSQPGVDSGVAQYKLLQFHFHTPSEHTVGGVRAQLEVHLVHKKISGPKEAEPFLVLVFFFHEGFRNSFLESFFSQLPSPPHGHGSNKKTLSQGTLLKLNRMINHVNLDFLYLYKGSLTTPPCSEVVQWVVVASPLTASLDQIDDVVANLPEAKNARPVQQLGSEQTVYATPQPGKGSVAVSRP